MKYEEFREKYRRRDDLYVYTDERRKRDEQLFIALIRRDFALSSLAYRAKDQVKIGKEQFWCEHCEGVFRRDQVEVDHIRPIVFAEKRPQNYPQNHHIRKWMQEVVELLFDPQDICRAPAGALQISKKN